MTRCNAVLLLVAVTSDAPGQLESVSLPAWLSHYPGAEVTASSSPGLAQTTAGCSAPRV